MEVEENEETSNNKKFYSLTWEMLQKKKGRR